MTKPEPEDLVALLPKLTKGKRRRERSRRESREEKVKDRTLRSKNPF